MMRNEGLNGRRSRIVSFRICGNGIIKKRYQILRSLRLHECLNIIVDNSVCVFNFLQFLYSGCPRNVARSLYSQSDVARINCEFVFNSNLYETHQGQNRFMQMGRITHPSNHAGINKDVNGHLPPAASPLYDLVRAGWMTVSYLRLKSSPCSFDVWMSARMKAISFKVKMSIALF